MFKNKLLLTSSNFISTQNLLHFITFIQSHAISIFSSFPFPHLIYYSLGARKLIVKETPKGGAIFWTLEPGGKLSRPPECRGLTLRVRPIYTLYCLATLSAHALF